MMEMDYDLWLFELNYTLLVYFKYFLVPCFHARDVFKLSLAGINDLPSETTRKCDCASNVITKKCAFRDPTAYTAY